MITTTYTCDRCRKTGTPDKLPLVQIRVIWLDLQHLGGFEYPAIGPAKNPVQAQWCYQCLREMGLDCAKLEAIPNKTTNETIEDVIRNIVCKELDETNS